MRQIRFLPRHAYDQYPPLVQAAISIIETDFSLTSGIEELAKQLSVSMPHLIRVFSSCVGMTPGKYLAYVRMFHAKAMLQAGAEAPFEAIPLEAIAEACGYSCANYFSKAFKKNTGLTPTQYVTSTNKKLTASINEYVDFNQIDMI